MKKLTIEELKNYTNGKFLNHVNNSIILDISIDSRDVSSNSLFIPIIGETHDGHCFMESAYENGCRNFLIDKDHVFDKKDINLIEVNNTLFAFGDIAKAYKNNYDIPYIAITGSVGKTSTKDIISSVLTEKYRTLKNIGNFNNEIGIPKTLLNLDETYDMAVVEMGMSFKGDLHYFSSIVNPNVAVISNIGMSHIENFDDQTGIFNGKMEITDFFDKNNVLIINGDDKFLKTLKEKELPYKLLSYGFEEDNTIYCKSYEIEDNCIKFECVFNNEIYDFVIPTIAKHNIYNAMSAILVGSLFNMTIEEITRGLKTFEITKGRLTIISKKDLTIIDDTYNASADSMNSALGVLKTYNKRRVAVLGDILETGKYAESLHRSVGNNIVGNVDFLITVGNDSNYILDQAIKNGFDKENTRHFNDYIEVIV